MTKGEIMNKVFGVDYSNVDAAIPIEYQREIEAKGDNVFWYVMDYNNSTFGELVDMRIKLKEIQ